MNRAKAHHYWKALKTPSLIVLIISALLFSGIAVYALRANNLRMLELKQAVFVADEQNGDVEAALQELRSFVNAHMNTRLRPADSTEPPIQLVNQFNRYIEAEQAKLAAQGGSSIVYQQAQARCETGAIPLTARAQCIQEYVLANGGTVKELTVPPKELYTYDFVSPSWSFDIAGIAIILAGLSVLLLLARLVLGRILRDI